MGMRETLDGFQGGLQIGGRMVTNLRYADDIILLATLEAELQESVDRPTPRPTQPQIHAKPRNLHICITSSQFSLLAALAVHLWSHSLAHPHHLLYE